MDVNKLTLDKVFDPTVRLEAPLFQRPYVWNQKKNWEPLWESIQHIADKRFEGTKVRPHFLGTVVLDQLKTSTGSLYARQIIDGQQRLTTLQIALAAIRDLCGVSGQENFKKAFTKLTDNDTPLSDDPDDVFKVWPTNADRSSFSSVMRAGSPDKIGRMPAGESGEQLIPEAYLYFSDAILTWLGGPPWKEEYAKRVRALYETLKDQLNLVVIDLDQDDDAQEIFQTLNALGTPLLPTDLVKNFLFHRAEGEDLDTEKLYMLHWKQFDDQRAFWRKEVGQGRFKRPRLDWFLQHYLTLVIGEEAVTTQLFSSFRDYVRIGKRSTSEYLNEFESYSGIYKSFEEFPKETWAGLFFYRLRELDTSTVFPLLLEVFKTHPQPEDETEVKQICGDLESFLVRRAVCQLTPKNYNRFFVDVIQKLRHQKDFSAAAIRSILLEQTVDTSRWPNDDEFRGAWMITSFYGKHRRTRVILEALDAAMQTEKTEKIAIKEKLTIEHLMPQHWEQYWPLPEGGNADHRNSFLHKVGNLTLLTKKLNPAVSNGSWELKRKEILKHSAIAMNRQFQEVVEWNEDRIRARTEELFELGKRIWLRPSV
jgi:uncharacterized protein with ParB-like and HNH nuclease domain